MKKVPSPARPPRPISRPKLPEGVEIARGSLAGRALIFDSLYDDHKGIIANVRVFDGEFKAEDMKFIASGTKFKPKEVGYFSAGHEGFAGR